MRERRSIFRFSLALLSAVVFASPCLAGEIAARLQPNSIALNEATRLIVSVEGNQSQAPAVPQVDGLQIQLVRQESSFQFGGGPSSIQTHFVYQVTPQRVGNFTIPAIQAADGSKSQPLTLQVVGSGQSPPPPSGAAPSPGATATDDGTKKDVAFLRVTLPKDHLVVGEIVPVQVKAYFRAGMAASLNGLPVLNGDAFTLNKLANRPDARTQELVQGQPFIILTWNTALCAVKAGEYPLKMEMPVTVQVRQKGRRGGGQDMFRDFFGNSPFDDSFLNNFFGQVSEKEITLQTEGSPVKVDSLPTEGRPAGFSGAVGKFEVSGEAAPAQTNVGDPVTLRLRVTGKGNFDRVSTEGLPPSGEWKTYKPTSHFEPSDPLNIEGVKSFEQAVIPLSGDIRQIPQWKFSYFDPDEHRFVTKSTQPIALMVAQGAAGSGTSASAPGATAAPQSEASRSTAPKPAAEEIAPDQTETGERLATLRPLILSPWYLGLNAGMVAALMLTIYARGWWVRHFTDPERRRHQAANEAVQAALAQMDKTLKSEDAPGFFAAARAAVQERLGQYWDVSPSTVTPAEIQSRMSGSGEDLHQFFQVAAEVSYSGRKLSPEELQRWDQTVRRELSHIDSL